MIETIKLMEIVTHPPPGVDCPQLFENNKHIESENNPNELKRTKFNKSPFFVRDSIVSTNFERIIRRSTKKLLHIFFTNTKGESTRASVLLKFFICC